jgi:hypothetical protein
MANTLQMIDDRIQYMKNALAKIQKRLASTDAEIETIEYTIYGDNLIHTTDKIIPADTVNRMNELRHIRENLLEQLQDIKVRISALNAIKRSTLSDYNESHKINLKSFV